MRPDKHPLLLLCLILCLVCLQGKLQGQNQNIADSLKSLIQTKTSIDSLYLEDLENIAYNEQDPEIAEAYADTLIDLAIKLDLKENLLSGYLQKGNADRLQGNTPEALNSFFNAVNIALELEQMAKAGAIYGSIADIYVINEDSKMANRYYNKSISALRNSSDTISLSTALLNAGDGYLNQEKYDTALTLFKESKGLFQVLEFDLGIAYNEGNMAMAYKGLDMIDLAESFFNKAIRKLEELEDYYPICVYLLELSEIHHDRGQHNEAMAHAKRSLDLAEELGLTEQLSDAHFQLDDLHQHFGDYKNAYFHYKNHIKFRDEITNIENTRKIAEERADFGIRQEQLKVELLEQQKENQRITIIAIILTLALISVLALGIYRRYRFTQKAKKIIEYEKQKSENLLLNILPEETAQELKEKGKVTAQRFDSVTVLFTDFKGFTSYAENLTPEELVESVDFYFSKFDEIMEKYDLEKIKTVGDAYMCAGGLPYPTEDHAYKMCLAALEIADFVNTTRDDHTDKQTRFDIRIGINTGPVVAGVVGSKKFAYDIWGDAVNIASRMESNSEPGRVNISEYTYELVKDKFNCEYRGEVAVKNRGLMKMYFLDQSIQEAVPSR